MVGLGADRDESTGNRSGDSIVENRSSEPRCPLVFRSRNLGSDDSNRNRNRSVNR